jgi:hypothetical protein
MSDVYRAVDEQTKDPVAVKVVRSADPELARRLAQEVRVHERMEHPGLIRLISTGVADGQAYLITELIEGTTLAASLRDRPLGSRLTAKMGKIVAEALAYVHAQGIVHRDVKPSNIMLGADGRALLGDFGIARLVDGATFTVDGTTVGTAAYMAPEQLEDHQVGPAADIWSLGVVLLESLTGRRTYDGSWNEIIARRLSTPVPLPGDLPVPWKLLLTGMLDHRPAQRLDGAEVASLLASSTFAAPWTPSATDHPDSMATVPLDLTALVPRQPAVTAPSSDGSATAVLPPAAEGAVATNTAVQAAPTGTGRRHRGWLLVLGLVAFIAALAGGLAYGLGLGSHSPHVASPPSDPHHTASAVLPTTTVPPTTTTTTAAPTPAMALGTLVSDVTSAVSAGTLSPGIGQIITNQAQQSVIDESAGHPNQAANDLQQVAATIAQGSQSGAIPPAEAATLQGDLSTLAATLGLSAASTPPTTTTPTTATPTAPAPTPGPLPGGGHGHKGGNG